ncbi:MAG TPA: sensor histidine kinase [Jiangellaceae bacterium]
MAGGLKEAPSQADELRRVVPVFALVVAIVAVVFNPPSAAAALLLAPVPVAAFGLWAIRPTVPLLALSVAVIVPAVLAQRDGKLEPLLFEVALLAFLVACWSPSLTKAALLGVLAVASPIAVSLIQEPSEIAVGIWILGISFTWVLGRAVAHQGELSAQLDATRRELAQQALFAERRRIARDVHDFVGHGLAAVMLQITSARHVLRRDPTAAEEALRSAEEVGRRSMQELRRTVALLRSDDDTAVPPPLVSATGIPALVDDARASGLPVELQTRGNLSVIPASVGIALYRIIQEVLANVVRHAPGAPTTVKLDLAEGRVSLVAESSETAAAVPAAKQQPGYGLVGMRERVTALGGEFDAGPTPDGWRVRCQLPLDVSDVLSNRDGDVPDP